MIFFSILEYGNSIGNKKFLKSWMHTAITNCCLPIFGLSFPFLICLWFAMISSVLKIYGHSMHGRMKAYIGNSAYPIVDDAQG